MMSKILLLLLPLLFLDGAHLDSVAFRKPQPGKPWVAPTFMMNSTESTEEMSKENDFDLDQYDSQFYQPAPEKYSTDSTEEMSKENDFDLDQYYSQFYQPAPEKYYTKPPTSQQRPGYGLRGYRCPQPNGYFKYTDRCDEYVQCKNFIPITHTCPIGLHFNVYLQWTEVPCDHPSRVQCNSESGNQKQLTSSTTTTTTTTTTTPAPKPRTPKVVPDNQSPNFVCPQPFGYFKHNYECAEYVECKNYMPVMFTCPLGLNFNPRAQWTEYPCDHPSRVECNRQPDDQKPRYAVRAHKPKPKTTTTTTTTTTTPRPVFPTPEPKLVSTPYPGNQITGFSCPHPHGYFRHTDQCGEYIECKHYVPITYSCPAGLHFNPLVPWTQYPCDYPSNVQCNIEPATSEPPTTTTTTTTTPQPPTSSTTEPAVIAPRPKTAQPNNLCPQPYGYFKHSNKCGEYVECKNYVPLYFICPIGLHFNHQAQWTEYPCVHPSQVQCEEEPSNPRGKSPLTPRPNPQPHTTTTPPSTTTTLAPATPGPKVVTPRPGRQLVGFKCPQPHGYFEHIGQCGEYVECKNHIPMSNSCPAGLHFNSRVQWTEYPCDHPSKAQCERRQK